MNKSKLRGLDKIDLQRKTIAETGSIEKYWFENATIGLPNTLFHRIVIPLKSFNSGLDYVPQPEDTELVFEWFDLSLSDPNHLDRLDLSHENYPSAEGSVYIGSAHNLFRIKKLSLERINGSRYKIIGEIDIDFQKEGVAENESFAFTTEADFK